MGAYFGMLHDVPCNRFVVFFVLRRGSLKELFHLLGSCQVFGANGCSDYAEVFSRSSVDKGLSVFEPG